MNRVSANGLQITLDDTGEGEPLILLHGTQADRRQFRVFTPLLGEGIRAIAYDQRDSPDTPNAPVPEAPYAMLDHANDCLALIKALGLERVHIMGTSYGGAVAMTVAIHHPAVVASLVLAATTPSWSMVESIRDEGASMRAPDDIEMFMLGVLLSPEAILSDANLVEDTRSALCQREPTAIDRRMSALFAHDCIDALPRIQTPTLILHGTEDPIIRPSTAEFMARQIPQAELKLLEGSRHGITLEHRDRTAAAVREFILANPVGGIL